MNENKSYLSIIQPSFFPYLGYFKIIAMSKIFVFYDHVQYDKHGWRNRNKILINKKANWITLPVKISDDKKIQNVKIYQPQRNFKKIFKNLSQNYSKSLNFKKIILLLEEIFFYKEWESLSEFNIFATKKICDLLNITTDFYKSSDFENINDKNLNIIRICKKFNIDNYLSGKLAQNYIDTKLFEKNEIRLKWFEFKNENKLTFENLSIIHYLFNTKNFKI